MFNDKLILNQKYNKDGFFIIKNFIDDSLLNNLFNEIISSDKTSKHFDRKGKIRRIEKIYDKGPSLIKINEIFKEKLKEIFGTDFHLFKDKYNAKPPNGEGFFAHYDGIFLWKDKDSNLHKGWHIYADEFVNVLVAIDNCTIENGALEISPINNGDFDTLYKNTKKDGTPDLSAEYEKKLKFYPIILNRGDAVFFSSKCPHRSKRNLSKGDRKTIYYTYNFAKDGDNYEKYFSDKEKSQNKTSKSLSGEI